MTLSRLKALDLLYECDGDEIWPIDHCQSRGVPSVWIDELQDCFESDFSRDEATIYEPDAGRNLKRTNQFEGIRAVDLAMKLGEYLNVDVHRLEQEALSRSHLVKAICEAAEEG